MSGLTPKQEHGVAALLTEPSITKAAEKVGVTERTLHRWLDDPAFTAAYRQARREAVGQAISRLHQVATHAVTVLLQVMADPKTPASVRVAAASKVLDLAIRAIELEDIEARLAALEEAQRAPPRR